ncbi:winged helix-turn-helix domain-containing protein, partial [Phytohabitans kaempferiae]
SRLVGLSAWLKVMRYGDGGGLNQAARVRREQVRREAAGLFAQGVTPVEVAKRLEVSEKSAYVWRKLWRAGGADALVSKGAPGPDPRLSDAQLVKLKARLELGPVAAGYGEDQRWTLARIRTLIGAMFKVRVSVTTTWEAMRRIGYSAQMPTHRAIERDEEAIARWRRYQWPAVKESRAG